MDNIISYLNNFEYKDFLNTTRNIRRITSKNLNDFEISEALISISLKNNRLFNDIMNFAIFMKTNLRQKLLEGTLKAIKEIDYEVYEKAPSDQSVNQLNNEKMLIEIIYKEEINESIELIQNHSDMIKDHLLSFKIDALVNQINKIISKEEKSLSEINKEIIFYRDIIKKINGQIDIITKSEEIIHNESLLSIFSSALPTKKTISDLKIEKSQKNVLTLLIDLLSNFFSHLESSFSYKKLVETRHKLVKEYLYNINERSKAESKKRKHSLLLSEYHSIINIKFYIEILTDQINVLDQYWLYLSQCLIALKDNIMNAEKILYPHIQFLDRFLHHHE